MAATSSAPGARYSLNGTFDRTEYFYDTTSSGVVRAARRGCRCQRNERPLFARLAVYFVVRTARSPHLDRQTEATERVIDDRSLGRFDFAPQIRYPFKRWQWLHRQLVARLARHLLHAQPSIRRHDTTVVDDNLNRQYFTMQAQAVGPVFTRVWNTPDNGYAERFKHTDRTVSQRAADVGRSTTFDRIVVDRRRRHGRRQHHQLHLRHQQPVLCQAPVIGQVAPSVAQEILSVEMLQTYYTRRSAVAVRHPLLHTSFSRRGAEQLLADRAERPGDAGPRHQRHACARSSTAGTANSGRCRPTAATTGAAGPDAGRLEPTVLHRGA